MSLLFFVLYSEGERLWAWVFTVLSWQCQDIDFSFRINILYWLPNITSNPLISLSIQIWIVNRIEKHGWITEGEFQKKDQEVRWSLSQSLCVNVNISWLKIIRLRHKMNEWQELRKRQKLPEIETKKKQLRWCHTKWWSQIHKQCARKLLPCLQWPSPTEKWT